MLKYSQILCFTCHCIEKRTKINKKWPGLAHLKNLFKALSIVAAKSFMKPLPDGQPETTSAEEASKD